MSYRTDCTELDEVSDKDRESIRNVLTFPHMKRLMGTALREMQGKKDQISTIDLGTDEGIRKGLKLQGEILGMARFLDLMLEGTNLE